MSSDFKKVMRVLGSKMDGMVISSFHFGARVVVIAACGRWDVLWYEEKRCTTAGVSPRQWKESSPMLDPQPRVVRFGVSVLLDLWRSISLRDLVSKKNQTNKLLRYETPYPFYPYSAITLDNTPTSTSAKKEKLSGFSNWARWASLTKFMLIEKKV